MSPDLTSPPRRPLRSRQTGWANMISQFLIKSGIRPNTISVVSIFFAAAACTCLLLSKDRSFLLSLILYLLSALFIQMRLLCNLFDGMVAIEGGFKSKLGGIFNELPDRIADTLIIVPVGYLCQGLAFGVELGWLAGTLAMLTAYIRLLGDSVGAEQYFSGPMAKPHRMALLTAAMPIAAIMQYFFDFPGIVFYIVLLIVVLGCIITAIRRLRCIVGDLTLD
ncbi:MAG: CDP-alcohol phosphatidyltransferase family protein [Planctomycetes bacterium]|nr:CDP-alcohol phosphatidyltransferase family protein [Planctomycetota bacterium]